MSRIAEWFTGLGAKRTPSDPTGQMHRRRFLGFCTAMIVLIWLLVGIRTNSNAAVCYADKSLTKTSTSTISVTLKASGMCGTVRGPGARFTRTPTWTRTYHESPTYKFNKWFPNASASGVGTAPNGDRNVAYVARWSAGEFVSCFPPVPCITSFPHGARLWIWANGQWQGAPTTVVPYTPLPRP